MISFLELFPPLNSFRLKKFNFPKMELWPGSTFGKYFLEKATQFIFWPKPTRWQERFRPNPRT